METDFQLTPTTPHGNELPQSRLPLHRSRGDGAWYGSSPHDRPHLDGPQPGCLLQAHPNPQTRAVRWKEYSQAANLTAPHTTIQLLACLDPKLRRDVTMNATGPTPLREYAEPDLLAAIKAMAVQEENKRAARVTLSRMTQDRGETIRSFVARLWGQAEVCRFDRKCTGCETVNSQSEDRVADRPRRPRHPGGPVEGAGQRPDRRGTGAVHNGEGHRQTVIYHNDHPTPS